MTAILQRQGAVAADVSAIVDRDTGALPQSAFYPGLVIPDDEIPASGGSVSHGLSDDEVPIVTFGPGTVQTLFYAEWDGLNIGNEATGGTPTLKFNAATLLIASFGYTGINEALSFVSADAPAVTEALSFCYNDMTCFGNGLHFVLSNAFVETRVRDYIELDVGTWGSEKLAFVASNSVIPTTGVSFVSADAPIDHHEVLSFCLNDMTVKPHGLSFLSNDAYAFNQKRSYVGNDIGLVAAQRTSFLRNDAKPVTQKLSFLSNDAYAYLGGVSYLENDSTAVDQKLSFLASNAIVKSSKLGLIVKSDAYVAVNGLAIYVANDVIITSEPFRSFLTNDAFVQEARIIKTLTGIFDEGVLTDPLFHEYVEGFGV